MKRVKKLMALILVLCMTLTLLPVQAAQRSFSDVSRADWYYNAVQFAVENNLFQGTSATSFSPNAAMTRGMFITVLGRAAGVETSKWNGSVFYDVSASAYYAPYVMWAEDLGIASGTGGGAFSPDRNLSRQELTTMLYRYVEVTGGDTEIQNAGVGMDNFNDWGVAESYALVPLLWAVDHKILSGSNGFIDAYGSATRAQVAQICMNAYDIIAPDGGTAPVVPPTSTATVTPGTYICYTDANGLTYAEDKRPLLNLHADKSFTVLMNDGNTMHSGSGTWRIFVSDGGENYLLIDITSLDSWPEQDDYAFYIAKNGTLIKCDGSLGITPVDSVFEPMRESDAVTEPLPEEPKPEEPKPEDPKPGEKPGTGGTPAPNDPGGEPPPKLIPTTREGLNTIIDYGPTVTPNDPEGARTRIIEWIGAPVQSFTSSTLVFKGSWTTAYYYYPSYQAAQNAIARAEFGVSSLSALTAKQLESVNASADFIASGKLVGSKSTGSVTFGSMRSGNELLLYTGNIVLDEGPYVNSGNPLVGSWRISSYAKTGLDSTQFYLGTSIPELYYDSEQCALIGNTSSNYASGASRDVSFVLFFDLNSAGELIAEGLAVCTDDMGLHLYQRLSLKIDMDASFI